MQTGLTRSPTKAKKKKNNSKTLRATAQLKANDESEHLALQRVCLFGPQIDRWFVFIFILSLIHFENIYSHSNKIFGLRTSIESLYIWLIRLRNSYLIFIFILFLFWGGGLMAFLRCYRRLSNFFQCVVTHDLQAKIDYTRKEVFFSSLSLFIDKEIPKDNSKFFTPQ